MRPNLRTLLAAAAALCCSQFSLAGPVSEQQASNAVLRAVAIHYPSTAGTSALSKGTVVQSPLTVTRVDRVEHNGELVGYAVALGPSGYYLVRTDDELPPWKLRSDQGSFENLPPGFLAVIRLELAGECQALANLRKANESPDPKYHTQWKSLFAPGKPTKDGDGSDLPKGGGDSFLLETTWNQVDPYNLFCPTHCSQLSRAPVGCSACALAQILRYHRSPEKITGDHVYEDTNYPCRGIYSAKAAGLEPYDWDDMPTNLTHQSPESKQKAVARLMYHCAVVLESNFETNSTTASLGPVPSALRDFFGYTCSAPESKDDHANWFSMIVEDIDAKRPIYYALGELISGVRTNGHAVVCDGYSIRNGAQELHLNLGWGIRTHSDWYNMDSVVVKTEPHTYNWTIHHAVFNITPPEGQPPSEECSLEGLYSALLGGGRITLTQACTFNLTAAIPIVRDTILDAGASSSPVVFNGRNATRLFTVRSNVTFQLINATLSNGRSTNGGAIFNQGGTLIASDCVFSGNAAVGPDGANGLPGQNDPPPPWRPQTLLGDNGHPGAAGMNGWGGAVYNLGRSEFYRCRFQGNSAIGGDGGQGGAGDVGELEGGCGGDGGGPGAASGGAVYSTSWLVLSNCNFAGNTVIGGDGGQGGLPGATDGSRCSPAGTGCNGAAAMGGGVYAEGQLLVSGCTFTTNSATGGLAPGEFRGCAGYGFEGNAGGTALGGAICADGTSKLVNCTFSGNSVQGGTGGRGGDGDWLNGGNGGDGGGAWGGALCVYGQAGATNCTFASGSAAGGAGAAGGAAGTGSSWAGKRGRNGAAKGGSLATGAKGTLTLKNCIVAYSPNGGNGCGNLVDAGHNVSSDGTCGFIAASSQNDTDPLLGTLGSYGGDTQTIPLLVTTDSQGCQGCDGTLWRSPAIDAGEVLPWMATDQRGVLRPQGAGCDLGAFECMAVVGQVWQFDGAPLSGLTISLLSIYSPTLTTVTDVQGRYQFVALPDQDLNLGVYRVVPQAGEAVFSPPYVEVRLEGPAQSRRGVDFESILTYGLNPEGAFRIFGGASVRQSFRVDAAEVLPLWHLLGTVTTGPDGLLEFLDSEAHNFPIRFYRVLAQ